MAPLHSPRVLAVATVPAPAMAAGEVAAVGTNKQCIGRYELLRRLQEGATSHVYLARDVYTNDIVAVKKVSMPIVEDSFDVAQHECWVHQQVDSHPNIVRLRGMSVVSPYEIAIATDFVPGGDLFEVHRALGKFTVQEFLHFAVQITSALAHMHSLGFAHCDLKPENCLVWMASPLGACREKCDPFSWQVKLADFGSARHVSERSCVRTHGTNGFQSPEEILGRRMYDYRPSDVWALGVTMFNLLTGHLPFGVAHLSDLDFACHMRGRKTRRKAMLWGCLPRGLAALLDRMLHIDRRKRPDVAEVHDELVRLQLAVIAHARHKLRRKAGLPVVPSPSPTPPPATTTENKAVVQVRCSPTAAMLGS